MKVVFVKEREGVDLRLTIGNSYHVLDFYDNTDKLDEWGKIVYRIADDYGDTNDFTEPFVIPEKIYRKNKLKKIMKVNEGLYK